MLKLKLAKFPKDGKSFSERYQQCNQCKNKLNIKKAEEILCLYCGETFCNSCIEKHMRDEMKEYNMV